MNREANWAVSMFTMGVVLSNTNQTATMPKAIFPMPCRDRSNMDKTRLNPAARIKGKKNSPAKSLSFPVSQEGLITFSTWSLSRRTAMLNKVNGC